MKNLTQATPVSIARNTIRVVFCACILMTNLHGQQQDQIEPIPTEIPPGNIEPIPEYVPPPTSEELEAKADYWNDQAEKFEQMAESFEDIEEYIEANCSDEEPYWIDNPNSDDPTDGTAMSREEAEQLKEAAEDYAEECRDNADFCQELADQRSESYSI